MGSPCITRAPRSCSADPLSPGSAALTFQLSTAHCCSQMSTALPLGPCCPPRLHHYLRSASAFFLAPALGGVFLQQGRLSEDGVRFISEEAGFISLHYSFVFLESKVLLRELGEAVLGQGTVRGPHMVSSFWATGQCSLPTWSAPFTSGGFHRTPLCLSLLIRPFQGLLPTSSSEVSLKLLTWFKFSLAGSRDLCRSRELAGRLLPWGILGKAEVLSVQGRQGTFKEVWPLSQSNLIESLNPITCLPLGRAEPHL